MIMPVVLHLQWLTIILKCYHFSIVRCNIALSIPLAVYAAF